MSHGEHKAFNICYVCMSYDIFFKELFELVSLH